jgi:hypothetical protein
MPVHGEIRKEYVPWKTYYGKEDLLTATHSVIEVDGPMELYCMAIEVPFDKNFYKLVKWMKKEIDTATRFSLTDGTIQIEIELWDGDESDKLYFCGDLTLKEAIKLCKHKHFAMGFVPVGTPEIIAGGTILYEKETLVEIIRLKQKIDARSDRPTKWKVG